MPFALSGYKWGVPTNGEPSGPVYWSSDIGAAQGLNYNTALYSDANFDTELQQAFQAWENISGVDFEVATADNPAVLTVGMGSLPGSTVGQAFISFQPLPGTDQIISVDITMDSDEFWSPEGDPGSLDFYAVALHEIGHGIGLDHVDDITEIMNPFVAANALGAGDIEGAREIYGNADGDPDDPTGGGIPPTGGTLDDDGGSSGGVAAFLSLGVIGLIAAVIGALGGGGAAAGLLVLAAEKPPEEDEDEVEGELSTDLHRLFKSAEAAEAYHAEEVATETFTLNDLIPSIAMGEIPCDFCGAPGCGVCAEEEAAEDLVLI